MISISTYYLNIKLEQIFIIELLIGMFSGVIFFGGLWITLKNQKNKISNLSKSFPSNRKNKISGVYLLGCTSLLIRSLIVVSALFLVLEWHPVDQRYFQILMFLLGFISILFVIVLLLKNTNQKRMINRQIPSAEVDSKWG